MLPIDRREYLKYSGSFAAGPLIWQDESEASVRTPRTPSKDPAPPTELLVEYAEDPLGVETGHRPVPNTDGGSTDSSGGSRPGSNWTDYSLEMDFRIEQSAAGFVFRAQDPGNFYLWQIKHNSPDVVGRNAVLRTHKFSNGQYVVFDNVPFDIGNPGAEHHVTITLRGSEIITAVDGQEIDTTTDPTYSAGTIGFRQVGNEHVVVDDVQVTSPDGKVLFADDFSSSTVKHFSGGRIVNEMLSVDGEGLVFRADRTSESSGEAGQTEGPRYRPRLHWRFQPSRRGQEQASYRILVASNRRNLRRDVGDKWDSGRVESSRTTNITYQGPRLNAGEQVYWKVRVWDADGDASEWSDPGTWEAGLITKSDWTANWIGSPRQHEHNDPKQEPAPLLRREFVLAKRVKRARAYVSGLGFYELHLNGERIGDHVLDPGRTDYERTVLYATHDVTDSLERGANALGVELGRGRFGTVVPDTWEWENAPWWSDPQLRLQLEVEYVDGTTETVVSDDAWRVTDGPTRFETLSTTWLRSNHLQEAYDARHERSGWTEPGFDDGDWNDVTTVTPPDGEVTAQMVQPIKVHDTISPVNRSNPADGVYVFDLGQMIPGWPRLTVDAEAGTQVTLVVGEQLNDNGRVTSLAHEYRYTSNGTATETWHPRFTYTGFRYVEVQGYPGEPTLDDVEGLAVYSAIDEGVESGFACSSELLTQVHENTRWALLNNYHSVPTDTPTFERNGWTADALATAETAIYNFSVARFYRKWLRDIQDAQKDAPEVIGEEGNVPVIVPSPDWGYSGWTPDPAWQSAYPMIAWWVYQYYGDERVLQEHYEGIKKYIEYLDRKADGYIVRDGLGDWVGPWVGDYPGIERQGRVAPQAQPSEGPALVSTAYYYRSVEIAADAAKILGLDDDAETFTDLAQRIERAFNEEFFYPNQNVYRTQGTTADVLVDTDSLAPFPLYQQTSNVMPLAFGMVPDGHEDAVVDNLVFDIMQTHDGHLNTGVHGTRALLQVLTEYDRHDVAYTVATQRTYPSWGWWLENDITALLEWWGLDARSRDHHFLGSVDEWFYQYLAGIREPAEPGFDHVDVNPELVDSLRWVEATTETPHGTIESRWKQTPYGLEQTVTVPGTATGTIHVPDLGADTVRVEESGVTVWESGEATPPFPVGIRAVNRTADVVVVEVGAGTYTFKLTPGDLHVVGSRTDDGAIFTGGQTNRVDVDVEANEPVSVRDRVPDGWTVLAGDAHDVYREDGQRYIEFSGQEVRGTFTYFVEAPSGLQQTGQYGFGPVEAAPGPDGEWRTLSGSSDSNVVVGPDTTV